jgi:hypothetical protein
VQKIAGLSEFRTHCPRHTFAPPPVLGGALPEMTGRLSGHTRIGITRRCARLIDAPLRTRVNAVGEMLSVGPRVRLAFALTPPQESWSIDQPRRPATGQNGAERATSDAQQTGSPVCRPVLPRRPFAVCLRTGPPGTAAEPVPDAAFDAPLP